MGIHRLCSLVASADLSLIEPVKLSGIDGGLFSEFNHEYSGVVFNLSEHGVHKSDYVRGGSPYTKALSRLLCEREFASDADGVVFTSPDAALLSVESLRENGKPVLEIGFQENVKGF